MVAFCIICLYIAVNNFMVNHCRSPSLHTTMVLISRAGIVPSSKAAIIGPLLLTLTPREKVPGNLRGTGEGLQLTEEEWISTLLLFNFSRLPSLH